jgi:hypothetical protein
MDRSRWHRGWPIVRATCLPRHLPGFSLRLDDLFA